MGYTIKISLNETFIGGLFMLAFHLIQVQSHWKILTTVSCVIADWLCSDINWKRGACFNAEGNEKQCQASYSLQKLGGPVACIWFQHRHHWEAPTDLPPTSWLSLEIQVGVGFFFSFLVVVGIAICLEHEPDKWQQAYAPVDFHRRILRGQETEWKVLDQGDG